ncbi:MAG: hypothetical protein CFE36_09025 [Sphingomonadaceae bacterium PASS1]|nr:MAG: hypothetical protein CFE36_09025 [Sphingomonadaceae bacterium PASS1]
MDWIIGIGIALAAIIFYFSQKSSSSNGEDSIFVIETVRQVFDPLRGDMFPLQLASDSYLLGFLQTIIAINGHIRNPNMSTTQKGKFGHSILQRSFGSDWKMIADRMILLSRSPDDQFLLGSDQASQVVLLGYQKLKPESMAEPQIQYALQNARKASIEGKSSYEGAAALLMAKFLLSHKQTCYPELP